MTEINRLDAQRVLRVLTQIQESPVGNRCVECGHVKHNELGYCQVGQCSCESGMTFESYARMIRRDIDAVLEEAAQ